MVEGSHKEPSVRCWMAKATVERHRKISLDLPFVAISSRAAKFPKTYGKDFTIADCLFQTRLAAGYEKFLSDPKGYIFDESLVFYCWGDDSRFMRPWAEVNDIYVTLNIDNIHWVLGVVRLEEWCIDVYDCDQSAVRPGTIEKILTPLCEMILYLLDVGMPDADKAKYSLLSFNKFSHNIVPRVPKALRSGDCGMFAIMYIEYLTAKLDVCNVTSEYMQFWRGKWAVRIYHKIIDPC